MTLDVKKTSARFFSRLCCFHFSSLFLLLLQFVLLLLLPWGVIIDSNLCTKSLLLSHRTLQPPLPPSPQPPPSLSSNIAYNNFISQALFVAFSTPLAAPARLEQRYVYKNKYFCPCISVCYLTWFQLFCS